MMTALEETVKTFTHTDANTPVSLLAFAVGLGPLHLISNKTVFCSRSVTGATFSPIQQ